MSEASAMRSECAQTTQVRFTRACRQQKAQVTAHIDADLKKAGDAGLAEAGYTPTQAIGALWDLARRYRDDPEKIREALSAADDDVAADKMAERERRKDALERSATLVDTLCAQYGLSGARPDLGALSDREYYDQFMTEHFVEKGLINE